MKTTNASANAIHPTALIHPSAEIWRERGALAGFWTSRRPRRTVELEGGSVYFAVKGETVFRLPFVRIERVRDFAPQAHERWLDAWAIVCRPETTLVDAKRIYRLRGWRYLAPEDAPPDIGARRIDEETQPPHAAEEETRVRDEETQGRRKEPKP